MKLKFTLLSMLLAGWGLASAQDAAPTEFSCVADTWIRQNNETFKNNSDVKVEVRMDALKDDAGVATGEYAIFGALYGFNFNIPAGMKVESATVRLVTERWKGCPINVYGYSNDFVEGSATWGSESDYLDATLAGSPILTFTPAAQRNVALGDDNVGADYRDLEKWTNMLDITDYVKSLSSTATRVNLFLAPSENNTNQNCFYTKDVKDVTNAKDATLTFQAADLVPVLYLTFTEDTDNTKSVRTPSADNFVRSSAAGNNYATNAEMEIYTQAGDPSNTYFVGLMRFDLPSELLSGDYEISEATLRLVTTYCKGDRNMGIYAFGDFAENATWNNVGNDVLDALGKDPVANFTAAGAGDKALNGSDKIGDDYTTVESWTNFIDLTDYAKSVVEGNSTNLSFAIAKTAVQSNNNAVKFATRETGAKQGVKNDGSTFEFAAEDVIPQLILVYSKKEAEEQPGDDDEEDLIIEPSDHNTVCKIDEETGTLLITTANQTAATILITVPEGTVAVYYKIEPLTRSSNVLTYDAPAGYTEITPDSNGNYAVKLTTGSQGNLSLKYVDADDNEKDKNYKYYVTYDQTTGVELVESADAQAAAFFTLQGTRVLNPEKGQIYIMVVNGSAAKVVF